MTSPTGLRTRFFVVFYQLESESVNLNPFSGSLTNNLKQLRVIFPTLDEGDDIGGGGVFSRFMLPAFTTDYTLQLKCSAAVQLSRTDKTVFHIRL